MVGTYFEEAYYCLIRRCHRARASGSYMTYARGNEKTGSRVIPPKSKKSINFVFFLIAFFELFSRSEKRFKTIKKKYTQLVQ